MSIQPYLFFDGRCDEALSFYEKALGAEVVMRMRFKENPEPGHTPPGGDDKIMHSEFRVAGSTLMASDGLCYNGPQFQGFSLSLLCADAQEAQARFDALAEGGEVVMPIGKTFWSPAFGMVKDPFGVQWMVNVMPAEGH